MNKHTADKMQFVGRVGNHSTKPSARGVNLLDWGEQETLTPEQQRQAMGARVRQINETLRDDKAMPKWRRQQFIAEQIDLQEKMRAIRPTRRAPGVANYFMDVARERLTPAEFAIWMTDAVKQWEAAEGVDLPTAQKPE